MRIQHDPIIWTSIGQGNRQQRVLVLAGLIVMLIILNMILNPFSTGKPPKEAQTVEEVPGGRPQLSPFPKKLKEGEFAVAPPEEPPPEIPQNTQGAVLPEELLQGIRDDALDFFAGERKAYCAALAHASRTPQTQIEREARTDLTFPQLFANPEMYRGERITVTGTLRQLDEFQVGENEHGVRVVYEAWIFSEDSKSDPWVFHCTSVPEGMPIGKDLREEVRVTGYFLKRYQYPTKTGLYAAPMLIGKTIRWKPLMGVDPESQTKLQSVLLAITLIGVILACLIWYLSAQQKWIFKRNKSPLPEANPEEFLRGLKLDP